MKKWILIILISAVSSTTNAQKITFGDFSGSYYNLPIIMSKFTTRTLNLDGSNYSVRYSCDNPNFNNFGNVIFNSSVAVDAAASSSLRSLNTKKTLDLIYQLNTICGY